MKEKEIQKVLDSIPSAYSYGRRKTEFVLTGTFLLSVFGLTDRYNDVDILVIKGCDGFWSDFLNEWENSIVEKSENYECVKIDINGILFNFIQDDGYSIELDSMKIQIEGTYLDSLNHAIEAKYNLKREKDKTHFEMINQRLQSLIRQSL